jgi:hypothetical protein
MAALAICVVTAAFLRDRTDDLVREQRIRGQLERAD